LAMIGMMQILSEINAMLQAQQGQGTTEE